MRLLVLIPCLLLMVQAQDTVVTITGTGPRTSTAGVNINYKAALVTFSIGNGTIDGSGNAVLAVNINNKTGQWPAGLQFELAFNTADVVSMSFTLGPASSTAGKTFTCSQLTASSYRCIISGGVTGIADGTVLFATVKTSLVSQATTTVTALGFVAASIGANPINVALSPGGGVITMPGLLATVTCAQPDIWQGVTVACSATLNKPAPAAGAAVALTFSSPLVTGPATIAVAGGTTSATFNVLGN